MFQHQGIWLPKGEKHFQEWMTRNGEIVDGKGTYQIKKLRAAMEHVRQFQVAVDVGAHVGLWSMHLAKRFKFLHAFEPVEMYRHCWLGNVDSFNYEIHPCALGAHAGRVTMRIPELHGGLDTGGTHVGEEVGSIELRTLDSFELQCVDFIKIDCEGYEHHVIEGARETLLRCRPCVIVEQKPHKLGPNFGIKGIPAVDLLRELGAQVRREISGDYILTF
jgi:FkbM family methyltransferase